MYRTLSIPLTSGELLLSSSTYIKDMRALYQEYMPYGILFALIDLLGWRLADFLIEKSTRKMGDAASLFFITAIGSVILLPFVSTDIIPRLSEQA